MSKKIVIIIFGLLISCTAYGKLNYMERGKWKIKSGFDYGSSSSYYNLDGDQKIFDRDTFNIIIGDSVPYQYVLKHTYELKKYIFIPRVEYAIAGDFTVFAEIPLVWQSYTNKYEKDTNRYSPTYGRQTIRAEYSTFIPAYYGLGGYIRLNKGILNSSVLFGMQLPPKLKNGYQQDTTNNFYIYNAYKFYLGLVSTLDMEKGFLELETTYMYRSGDFADFFHIRLEGGFTSVPNTALKGLCIYDINLSGFDNAQPVNPRLTTLQEDVLNVGAAFEITVADRINVEFAYLISVGMTNTLQYGTLMLNTSVLIN